MFGNDRKEILLITNGDSTSEMIRHSEDIKALINHDLVAGIRTDSPQPWEM